MQFLKSLFWFLLAFILALFTYANWTMVPIRIGKLTADVNLPLLLVGTFLLGLLPTWAYYQAVRWRLRARLAAAERALASISLVPATIDPPHAVTNEPPPSAAVFTPTPLTSAGPVEPRP